jgi:hypothetical protein
VRSVPTFLIAGALAGLGILANGGRAHADRIVLTSGSVIEGKATRVGEKVIVELESGKLTLSAGSIQRIEQAESEVDRVDARLRALHPQDVHGLFNLADYCRDHGMKAREQELLERVIALAPDHPEARARLGYVRTEAGWVTRDEQLRAQGMVKHGGRWLTPEQLLSVLKLEAETEVAQLTRDQARVELESKRAELASQKAHEAYLERTRESQERAPRTVASTDGMAAYYGPYTYGANVPFFPIPGLPGRPGPDGFKPNPLPPPGPGPAPSPIPGFRDPSNMSWQVPGYQNPSNYFR